MSAAGSRAVFLSYAAQDAEAARRICAALRAANIEVWFDQNELVGKVKSRAFLTELGAEMLETSLILGDNAYDVAPGFVGAPIGSFADHRKSIPDLTGVARGLSTDEDLLATFLETKM